MFGKSKKELNSKIESLEKEVQSLTDRKNGKHKFSEEYLSLCELVDQKVIIRSNEDEPYKVGIFKGFIPVSQSNRPTPLVEIDGKEFMVFSVIVPFTEEMAVFLDSMTPSRQWDILKDVSVAIQITRD